MTHLLGLYLIITMIVMAICFYLWITKRPGEPWFPLRYAVGILLAPLWPLVPVLVILTLIAYPTTSMKGDE